MAKYDGGSAFVNPATYRADGIALDYGNPGMTKREWLAGLAMLGELNNMTAAGEIWRAAALAERAVEMPPMQCWRH